MKVKKRKPRWEAARYDGSGVPDDIAAAFDYAKEESGFGYPYLCVPKYDSDKCQWVDYDVHVGQWLVWSNFGKVKVLSQEEYDEEFEEA